MSSHYRRGPSEEKHPIRLAVLHAMEAAPEAQSRSLLGSGLTDRHAERGLERAENEPLRKGGCRALITHIQIYIIL